MGRFFKSKAFIAMCIIAALMLGLCLLSMTERGRVTILEDICGIFVTPIQKASNRLVGASGNFKRVFTEYDTLQQENEKLKQQLAEATEQIRDAEQAVTENNTLREALELSEEQPDLTFVSAHISGTDLNGYSQTVTLNKGSVHGVKAKDMVVTGDGIVGYVSEVGTTWCKVVTILDASSNIGVVLTRTGSTAVLQGDAALAYEGRCKVSFVKNDVVLAVGDNIETSGVGGIFPGGLFVGRIKEIKSETSGLAQYAIIEPAVDISSLSSVLIITDFAGKVTEE